MFHLPIPYQESATEDIQGSHHPGPGLKGQVPWRRTRGAPEKYAHEEVFVFCLRREDEN